MWFFRVRHLPVQASARTLYPRKDMPSANQAALRTFVTAIADGAGSAVALDAAVTVWQSLHPENSANEARQAVRRLVAERFAEILAETMHPDIPPINPGHFRVGLKS